MRVKLAVFLCVICFLAGCGNTDSELSKALRLREKIANSEGCSFTTSITADYGEKIYTFTMDCQTDNEGNLTFYVTEPATIAGVTGKIDLSGGVITFDDKVLAFQTIADDRITPVVAPWLLIKTLRSGYLRDSSGTENGYKISIDDSYEADALRLQITIENDLPVFAEIFWKGRRIMTTTVENFAYL